MPEDHQLLHDYAHDRSESAFSELVRRHVDLVYSAALRETHGDGAMAEDITQTVFAELARKASLLCGHPALAGWLYTCVRRMSANARRSNDRRQRREQEVHTMNELLSADSTESSWRQIEPVLDDAVHELSETDRAAVVLRFFEDRSHKEVGLALGLSESAARKRVDRALESLRDLLTRRGVTIGASGLIVLISTNAVHAAPVGLAITISTAAALTGTTIAVTATATATKAIAMTTLQKTIVTATIAVLAGAGIYEARHAALLRDQVQTLQQQQAPLIEQIQQLQRERDNATNRVAGLLAETSRLKSNPNQADLLKLRGEVTRLRNDAEQANDPIVKRALRWKANVEKMKLLFAEHLEQQVPEMKLLSEDYFFDLARDQDLESSNGVRKAFSEIRQRAKNTFAIPLQEALKKFLEENQGHLPEHVSDLKPYFQDTVDEAMLDQYKLLFTGKMSDVKGDFVLQDKQVVDPEFDSAWQIGPYAYGPDASGRETAHLEAAMEVLQPAVQSFQQSNAGATPAYLSQLKPYITTPEQQEAYDRLVKKGVSFGQP